MVVSPLVALHDFAVFKFGETSAHHSDAICVVREDGPGKQPSVRAEPPFVVGLTDEPDQQQARIAAQATDRF